MAISGDWIDPMLPDVIHGSQINIDPSSDGVINTISAILSLPRVVPMDISALSTNAQTAIAPLSEWTLSMLSHVTMGISLTLKDGSSIDYLLAVGIASMLTFVPGLGNDGLLDDSPYYVPYWRISPGGELGMLANAGSPLSAFPIPAPTQTFDTDLLNLPGLHVTESIPTSPFIRAGDTVCIQIREHDGESGIFRIMWHNLTTDIQYVFNFPLSVGSDVVLEVTASYGIWSVQQQLDGANLSLPKQETLFAFPDFGTLWMDRAFCKATSAKYFWADDPTTPLQTKLVDGSGRTVSTCRGPSQGVLEFSGGLSKPLSIVSAKFG